MTVSSRGNEFILYAIVGGPALLGWGLRKLNEGRLIQDTPVSKIRSAAMGIIALQGMAVRIGEIVEPIYSKPCCWWRCRVQEYRSNRDSHEWVTVKELASAGLFYIQDDTGKALVNAHGAEFNVPDATIPLDPTTRAQVEPLLRSWGVSDSTWFGGFKKMRLVENVIYDNFPIYILGEFGRNMLQLEGQSERLVAHLADIKSDPQKMEAVLGKDGSVDTMAWDLLVKKEKGAFMEKELEAENNIPECDKVLIRKPEDKPFIISTQSGEELAKSFGTKSLFMVVGGIALSGFGTFLALSRGISAEWAAIIALVGFIAGMALSSWSGKIKLGGGLWDWLSLS